MSDVKKQHMKVCGSYEPVIDLSLDGIQECKSSSLSADIYSVSFKNCKTVYPIKIIRSFNKFKPDEQEILKSVLKDINSNVLKIRTCVCDNPKRSFIRSALSHGASFAYEYCESRAEYIVSTALDNKRRGQLAWPFSTYDGPRRTIEKIKNITEKIENGENLSRDEAKCFYGTSPLLSQNDFHFIFDIPSEYMHSGCLGQVKRLLELTFNVGERRDRNTTRKLSEPSEYNKYISTVKVTREFSRRQRHLDFGVFKAQDFRNVILFFYPIVLQCIGDNYKKEKRIWLQLAYVMRSCVLPNRQFNSISKNVLKKTTKSFYRSFEALYGKKNCTYSVHQMASHSLEIRGDDPMTEKSAFKFENFYAEVRNLFQPGTISPTKQIIQNCFMKRIQEPHNCVKSIFFMLKKKARKTIH